MIDVTRDFYLNVSFKKGTFFSDEKIILVEKDNKSTKFIFKFEEDINNRYVRLKFKNYLGNVKEKILSVQNSKAELLLTRDVLNIGKIKMSISLIGNDNETLTIAEYLDNIEVRENLGVGENLGEDILGQVIPDLEQIREELEGLDEKVSEIEVPTKLSELENDEEFLKKETDPTVPAHVKQITEQNIESWNNKSDFSGNYEDLENKPEIPDVSKFIDNTVNNLIHYDTKKQVDEKIAKIRTMKLERVEVLPTENINTDTIYLVPKSNANNNNIYDQFVFFNDDWEKWGDTEIDLSNYATIEALNEALGNIDLTGYATQSYVDEKIGDIDTILSSIANESEAI